MLIDRPRAHYWVTLGNGYERMLLAYSNQNVSVRRGKACLLHMECVVERTIETHDASFLSHTIHHRHENFVREPKTTDIMSEGKKQVH